MQDFLIKLLVVALILYLLQIILDTFGLKEPASKIIFIVALVVSVIWLLFGFTFLPIH